MGELGKRLVRSLINDPRMSVLADVGVTGDDLDGDARRGFDWLMGYLADYGAWPTCKMLEESTGVFLPEEPDPLPYIVDVVRKRGLAKGLEGSLKAASRKIVERDPDEALRILAGDVVHLSRRTTGAKLVDYYARGADRVREYEALKASGGMMGFPTPWPSLDLATQGWVDGTLNVITGMTNTGKTWQACIISDDASRRHAKRVLLVTMEMSAERIERRLDAIRHKLPWSGMRLCVLPDTTLDEWRAGAVGKPEGVGEILVADKKMVRRVADAVTLCVDVKPDLVVVDGGYRFQGRRGGSSWEETVSVVNDLQLAAEQTCIPWVVTTQQGDAGETGKEKTKGKKIHAWGVRYGKEWVINPDVVLGIVQNADLRAARAMEIHFLKRRDAAGDLEELFHINWDLRNMDFSERGTAGVHGVGKEDDDKVEY